MTLDIQFKIRSNPNYVKFVREHSEWYKILSRHPEMFKNFEEEVKTVYKLRSTDKIAKTLDTIELVQNLLTAFK